MDTIKQSAIRGGNSDDDAADEELSLECLNGMAGGLNAPSSAGLGGGLSAPSASASFNRKAPTPRPNAF